MHTVAHRSHHPKAHHKQAKSISQARVLTPLKKMNKKVVSYVVKKPYKSAGIILLLSGVVLGMVYAKLKG